METTVILEVNGERIVYSGRMARLLMAMALAQERIERTRDGETRIRYDAQQVRSTTVLDFVGQQTNSASATG